MEKFIERYVLTAMIESEVLYGSHRGRDAPPCEASFRQTFDDTCFLQRLEMVDMYNFAHKQGYKHISVWPVICGTPLPPDQIRDLRRQALISEKELSNDDVELLQKVPA